MKKNLTVSLLLLFVMTVAAGTAVTLQDSKKLVGPGRVSHKNLSAEQTALKNVIAFMLYEWESYCETLPEDEAKMFRNQKNSPALLESREQSLKDNHRYEAISSKTRGNTAEVIVEENIKNKKSRYKKTLKKKAAGWIVVSLETLAQKK